MDLIWDALIAGMGFGLGLILAGAFTAIIVIAILGISSGLQRRY